MNVKERFLNYISFCTTSDELSSTTPSTMSQMEFAKFLKNELIQLGLSNVTLTEHSYLYALLPASSDCENSKKVGFISHMDTSPDFNGQAVSPSIIENYDGSDLILPASKKTLKVSDFLDLKNAIGKTLITTDGNSLLGADDKAGIAEIITAIEEIIQSNLPHGDIYIGFTPDEEIGRGADLFDFNFFHADFAYTVDGDYEGEISYENFNAASADFTIHGINVHPGEAKDIMVNAALVACELQSLLPPLETPAHTEGREGFYHLTDFSGNVSSATLSYIIRDHDKENFQYRLSFLEKIKKQLNEKYGTDTVELVVTPSYNNMLEIIEAHPYTIDIAREAILQAGLTPISKPVRGGTDGARLSFMGLPCPNLGTGGYGFHGPYEHITIESMQTVVKIIKNIAAICADTK